MEVGHSDARGQTQLPGEGVLDQGKSKGLGSSRAADGMRDLNHSSPTVQLDTESPRWPYWCFGLGRMRGTLCIPSFDGRKCPTHRNSHDHHRVKVNQPSSGTNSIQ